MIYRFRSFELDTRESSLRLNGERVETQPKVLDALRLFVENPGRLLTREELLARLWPGVIVGEESLTQVVRKLRQILGDDPQQSVYLMTVYKRGYRFLPEVAVGEGVSGGSGAPGAERAGKAESPALDAVPQLPEEAGAGPASPAPVATPSTFAVPAGASGLEGAAEVPGAVGRKRRRLAWGAAGLAALALLAVAVQRRAAPRPAPGSVARAADGGGWRARRLTVTPERESFPALSPDGTRYAFVRAGSASLASDLFVGDLDGGLTRLTATAVEEFAPQFSPDGRTLVYSIREPGRSAVWSVPVLGGAPRLLVDDAEWGTWSPDGGSVAFVRREPGERASLRALDLASGALRLLWSVAGPASAAAWSPDGRYVAAIGRNQVLVGPAAGAPATEAAGSPPLAAVRPVGPVFEYVRSFAWEPDSQGLIVDGRIPGEGGNLTRLALDGSPATALTRGSIDLFHPSLSRDGRRLLYAAEHKVRQIWRFDGERRPAGALSLPTAIECFDVAPDGRSLAATDWAAPTPQSTLVLFDLAGGGARALGAGLCPAFAPAGDRLAYLGYEEGSRGLWVLELASGDRRRVADDRGELGLPESNAARRPAWSPDGARIAYEGVDLPEGSGIYIVDLARGERRLVAPGLFGNLSWSPDGRFVAASGAGPESGFAVIDVARGRVIRVPGSGAYRASAHFRADGRVVFLVDQTAQPLLAAFDPSSLAADSPVAIELPVDASFWGLFEMVPDRRGGYLATVERYESDLYLADRDPL